LSDKQEEKEQKVLEIKRRYGDLDAENLLLQIHRNKELEKQEKLQKEIYDNIEKAFKPLEKIGVPIGKIGDTLRSAGKQRKNIVKLGDSLVKAGADGKVGPQMAKLGQKMQV